MSIRKWWAWRRLAVWDLRVLDATEQLQRSLRVRPAGTVYASQEELIAEKAVTLALAKQAKWRRRADA